MESEEVAWASLPMVLSFDQRRGAKAATERKASSQIAEILAYDVELACDMETEWGGGLAS